MGPNPTAFVGALSTARLRIPPHGSTDSGRVACGPAVHLTAKHSVHPSPTGYAARSMPCNASAVREEFPMSLTTTPSRVDAAPDEFGPMTITDSEALASLKLLVTVAKADGTCSSAERATLEDALSHAKLPVGVTVRSLLDGTYDADALAREVKSPKARDAAFGACLTMAHAHRAPSPQAQAVLERIEKAWAIPQEKKGLLGRLFHEARDTVWFTHPVATADPERRTAEINEDVLKYSILSGALGLNPVPIASIVTDLAVVGLQAKMFSDVGRHWGHESSRETAKQVLAGVGVGAAARIGVNQLVRFIPGAGSVFAASTNFASTWALGQVAKQYWQSGGKADIEMLGEIFTKSKAEGRLTYEQYKADIETKFAANRKLLDELQAEYAAGRITLADYERKVVELK